MIYDQKIVATALMAVPGIGVQTFQKIRTFCEYHHQSLSEWWSMGSASEMGWIEAGLSSAQREALRKFQSQLTPENYWEWLQAHQISVLWETDPNFPPLLNAAPRHPVILFAKGALSLANAPVLVGVVGTRKMTIYGQQVTQKIVAELIASGAVIVSGAMYGVDLTAHRAAVANQGQTIAVLGFGFGHWYPRSQRRVEAELLAAGALLVSEYAPGTIPTQGTFLQRNRIIAALTQAVIVTEAAERSGSINTAHWAAEYGRDVWAVPGSINSIYSEGVKNLINEGAKLLSSGFDLWEPSVVGDREGVNEPNNQGLRSQNSGLGRKILKILEESPLGVEELMAQLTLPINQVLSTLSELEMQQQVHKSGRVWWKS